MPNMIRINECSWVVKIYNNPAYILCPSFDFYNKIDVKEILKCNLSPADIDHCWRKKALSTLGRRSKIMVLTYL